MRCQNKQLQAYTEWNKKRNDKQEALESQVALNVIMIYIYAE